jgi:peptide/nickel transport system ATP-binding protein
MEDKLLIELKDLKIHFSIDEGILKAVDGVDLKIYEGKTLGLVGESGCGKSVTSQSLLKIVPPPGTVKGQILFHGKEESLDLVPLDVDGEKIRSIRGKEIAMIFQEPMTSFSPLYTMGNQIMEAIKLHRTSDEEEARKIAIEMFKKVGISNPEKRLDEYPHEFSGGMRQRVMIAMALSCHPKLLIADEPTTALDVTIQAQVLELMQELQQEFGMGILFITHDLGVVAEMCDEVAVMYLGKIVEKASVDEIFHNPKHPYTKGLLKSIPVMGKEKKERLASIEGSVPVPLGLPPMCGFYERCPHFMKGRCDAADPSLIEVEEGHLVRCFLYEEEPVKEEEEGEEEND